MRFLRWKKGLLTREAGRVGGGDEEVQNEQDRQQTAGRRSPPHHDVDVLLADPEQQVQQCPRG